MRFDVEGECHVVCYGPYWLSVSISSKRMMPVCRLTTNAHPIWCNDNLFDFKKWRAQCFLIADARAALHCFWTAHHPTPPCLMPWSRREAHVVAAAYGCNERTKILAQEHPTITVAEKWWDVQKLFRVETASMLIGSVQIKSDRLWHVLQGCFLTIFQSLGNRHQSLKARRWVPLSQPPLCMPVCTTCIPVILGKHMGNIWGTTATVGQA